MHVKFQGVLPHTSRLSLAGQGQKVEVKVRKRNTGGYCSRPCVYRYIHIYIYIYIYIDIYVYELMARWRAPGADALQGPRRTALGAGWLSPSNRGPPQTGLAEQPRLAVSTFVILSDGFGLGPGIAPAFLAAPRAICFSHNAAHVFATLASKIRHIFDRCW